MLPLISARTVVASTCFPFEMRPGGCRAVLGVSTGRWSVLVSQRELDVHSGQQHEDVGLQQRDQDLEEAERDAERERPDAEELEQAFAVEEEELRRSEEQDEQQVADDHV